MKFEKYKRNLTLIDVDGVKYVRSYSTNVARIDGDTLYVLGWWSSTTSKHINYAAKELGLTIKKEQ